jgi:sugar phosphate isomerase/epimerase
MKIGIIAELLKKPLYDCLARTAELGADGVQLYAVSPVCNLLQMDEKQLADLKKFCEDHKLAITAVCGDLSGHGFQIASENQQRIKTTRQIIDITRSLGCNIITMHVGVMPAAKDSPVYQIMMTALKELGKYAAANNAVIAIETGPESPETLKQFLDDAGTRGLGVNLDPANLVMALDENPAKAVYTLKDYIVHTHAKDGVHFRKCDPVKVYDAFAEGGFEKLVAETGVLFAEVPLGQGSVNWNEYLAALKAVKYNGFLTVERETGADPDKDIKLAIDFLKTRI